MIQTIITACQSTSNENSTNRLLILDARSYAAAIANRAKGGGFEYPPYYNDCDVQFMNLPNIHAIRKSAQMLRAAIANAAQGEKFVSRRFIFLVENFSFAVGCRNWKRRDGCTICRP